MLSDNNEKGVFMALFGIVAVFLVAIALAGLARNVSFSGTSSIKQEMYEVDMTLHRQEVLLEAVQGDYEKGRSERLALDREYIEKSQTIDNQKEKISELKGEVDELETQLAEVKSSYDKYRRQYRSQSRSEASGQKLDSITTRSGKIYKLVTIRQVYVDGMSISYDGGVVRLGDEDLDDSWSQRFDWNHDEQAEANQPQSVEPVLIQSSVLPKPAGRPLRADKPKGSSRKPSMALSPEAVALRSQLTDIRMQIQDVRGKLSNAEQQRAYGKNRSVPGSLETWDSYIQRMRSQLSRLESLYSSTKGKLRVYSPNEPEPNDVQE